MNTAAEFLFFDKRRGELQLISLNYECYIILRYAKQYNILCATDAGYALHIQVNSHTCE